MAPSDTDLDALDREMFRVLDEYRDYRFPAGPIVLSDGYLRLIDREERHPDNGPGSEKTWVQRARAAFRRTHGSAG